MNNKALSLIEIIVSILILTIIAAGMFSSFIGAESFFYGARHRIQAFNFAREAMDRLKSNHEYREIGDVSLDGIIRGEMVGLNAELTYDVSEREGAYKVVNVTVTWDERRFRE